MAKSKPFTIEDLTEKGFVADADGNYRKITNPNAGRKGLFEMMTTGVVKPCVEEIVKKEDVAVKKTTRPKAKIKIPKSKPEGLQAIENVLRASCIVYKTEYQFDETNERRFRFDVAFFIKDKKVAVEYEGLMSKKSRHTTITGYVNDVRKYNLAQLQGWIVLRYTAINYKEFIDDLTKFLI